MNRRAYLLEELGLAPRWVQREAAVAPAPEAVTATTPVIERRETPRFVDQSAAQTLTREVSIGTMDWLQLKQAVRECVACQLHTKRTQTVFGVGDEAADWLFIGEGPGAEEDARGEPFVGQAGRLLDNMLAALGMNRNRNVYIANVLKCRPPNNRAPEPAEADACRPYLERQVALLQPKLIVALGKSAASLLLGTDATIASLRGRVHQYRGVPLIVTYHPAYLLRSLPDKAKAWEDLLLARRTVAESAGTV